MLKKAMVPMMIIKRKNVNEIDPEEEESRL
jgi:hypothetical protein